ncbi:hypothetical protein ENBRE01_1981 [Enteropsectra breve]|nr:hypothetical protein ENBRE01_1981 [Enteropsectra breve]
MDNVPFHKRSEVGEEIRTAGYNILYLPPYSPFLNLIENMFSKWKQFIRARNPVSEEGLLELIDQGAILISNENCAGFFRHMLRFLPDSINGIAILDG